MYLCQKSFKRLEYKSSLKLDIFCLKQQYFVKFNFPSKTSSTIGRLLYVKLNRLPVLFLKEQHRVRYHSSKFCTYISNILCRFRNNGLDIKVN